jgi:hypothetical protein
MGEIAEMMLDGTLDCVTGEYIGPGPGYPRTGEQNLRTAKRNARRRRKQKRDKAAAQQAEQTGKREEHKRMPQTIYEGQPDSRQSDDVNMRPSRFRPRYRALTEKEVALHDAIKAKAAELEALFDAIADTKGVTGSPVGTGRPVSIAHTKLEESIMWAIKGLTA